MLYINAKYKAINKVVLDYLGDIILDIDDETVRQMREALEHNVHQTQIDPQLTNIILQQFEGIDVEVRKDAVVRALIAFTWTQRLYFIVRSAIMGLMGAGVTAIVVFLLGKVDAFEVVIISVMSFIVTLAITRLLDAQISQGSKQIILRLSQHRRLRAVILSHF